MRFAYIEAHLAVHGFVGRRDFHCCSAPNATKVLAKYKKEHPGWLVYSEVTKRYTCTKLPAFHLQVCAVRYLDAYNILYRGDAGLAVLLRERYEIVLVEGSLSYMLGSRVVPLLRSFRHRFQPQVGGFYCVPLEGCAFYMEK